MLCGISRVTVGGRDVTGLITKCIITDTLGEPSVCKLETVINPKWQQDIEPAPFSEVKVIDVDGRTVFGGRTNQQPQRTEEVCGARFSITASDWSAEASCRLVDEHFSGWLASDIYKALVEKYLPGHTTGAVQANEAPIDVKFTGQTLTQAFKTLCDLTQWTWRVDPDRDHYFGPVFVEVLTTTITDTHADTSKGATTRFEKDYSTLANRVWVEGGEAPARNFSEQYVAYADLSSTQDTDLMQQYPYSIPIWYKCQTPEVFAVFDSNGDGVMENGKLVRLNLSSKQQVANQIVELPTSQIPGADQISTVTVRQNVSGMQSVTGQSSRVVIADYDALFLDDGDASALGGHIYLTKGTTSVLERMNATDLTTGVTGLGYCYTNPALENETDKLLGFLVRYQRLMKISYVSDVDQDSVQKYGVQIDLPKVSKPAIKDWSVLYNYADFLLSSHRDPPAKGQIALWRYKNGVQVFDRNIRSGWLVAFNLERFGSATDVKVTKVTHEIEPHAWRMVVQSSLDPNLYQSMFADILRRVSQLEVESSTGTDVINSMRKIEQRQQVSTGELTVSTIMMGDLGFDKTGFGAGEWEG